MSNDRVGSQAWLNKAAAEFDELSDEQIDNDVSFDRSKMSAHAAREQRIHVDDWINEPSFGDKGEAYAKFVLDYMRKPAWAILAFRPWMEQHRLFCTYNGLRYRVTGASRLGDVWLSRNLDKAEGYELRVDVAKCEEWGAGPYHVKLVD